LGGEWLDEEGDVVMSTKRRSATAATLASIFRIECSFCMTLVLDNWSNTCITCGMVRHFVLILRIALVVGEDDGLDEWSILYVLDFFLLVAVEEEEEDWSVVYW